MNKLNKDLIIGILILFIGFFLLLINLDIIDLEMNISLISSLLFFSAFLFLIAIYYFNKRKEFWPLIPALGFLGLSILLRSNEIGFSYRIGTGIFLFSLGIAFIIIYFLHREHWWAIIPGGIIASISSVIFFNGLFGVALMFLGMGITFFALYPVLKKTEKNYWWPLIPGSILGLIGLLFIIFNDHQIGKFALPVLLILGGCLVIIKSYKKK